MIYCHNFMIWRMMYLCRLSMELVHLSISCINLAINVLYKRDLFMILRFITFLHHSTYNFEGIDDYSGGMRILSCSLDDHWMCLVLLSCRWIDYVLISYCDRILARFRLVTFQHQRNHVTSILRILCNQNDTPP